MSQQAPDSAAEEFLSSLPFTPDPFQAQAVHALAEGRSVLVAAPTGTGKTVVAEFAVDFALSRGLRAVYTTPIKALSNQKFRDFRARYGDRVGLLTGDLTQNSSGDLLVMTTEVARNMLIQDPASFQDVACLVFDEVHYLADPERGTAWEESILLAPTYVQLVCLSATVANASEIAEWIRTTGRDVALVESFRRVVPLKHRYYVDGQLIPILNGKTAVPVARQQRGGQRAERVRSGGNDWGSRARRIAARQASEEAPAPDEVVRALAEADLLPAIYFFFSRRSVEQAALSCQRLLLISRSDSDEVRRLAQLRLTDLSPEDRSLGQVEQILALLPRGVGFHHAGLLPPLKTLVEELLATGKLKVVFATDTLALGINVPARSTVIGEMTKFDGQSRRLLTPGEYRQLTGRAGRRGMDAVGYSVIPFSPWVPLDRTLEVAEGDVSPLESAFRPGYSTVLNLWHGPDDDERLTRLIAGSLRQFQHGGKIRDLTEEREEVARRLAEIPSTCPICGDFAFWRAEEKRLKREHDQADGAWSAARSQLDALEDEVSGWPWQYTRSQRKEWLRAAEPGAAVYSRRHGWMVYLGPSANGIGSFFIGGRAAPIASYADLDYLPDPPLQARLPDSVVRRAHLLDGAAEGLAGAEAASIASALAALPLPDLEAKADEVRARAREVAAPGMKALVERLEEAEKRRREAALALAQNPYVSCPDRPRHRRAERERRQYEGLLASLEQDLATARKAASQQAYRTLRSLRSVLEAFGYMSAGAPTRKAEVLRRVFDNNGLIVAELLDSGVLAEVTPVELAEMASWFAYDKEGSNRPLPITDRLSRVLDATAATERRVLEVERRNDVHLSTPLSAQFRGIGLAWATGESLGKVAERSGLAEGDVVFALQKTIDVCRQIAQAAPYSRVPVLAKRAQEAERLLRRGVVASYYRWVVGEPEQAAGQKEAGTP